MFASLALWLHSTFAGKFVLTMLISLIPVVELRGGLPAGVAMGLPIPAAFCAALIGNLLPVPFIILYVRKLFRWIRKKSRKLGEWVTKIETRAYEKASAKNIAKYQVLGLLLFVAIPLPGTGAWTGALIAALLEMRVKRAFPTIVLGVIIAGIIMTTLTYGVTKLL